MKKILVIANLHHASPRIPAIMEGLLKLGWQVSIVTVPLGKKSDENLGFSTHFKDKVRILEVSYSGDVLGYLRRILDKIGFSSDESYTEQIKTTMGIKKRKSIVDRLLWWYQEIFAFPDAERTWKKPAIQFITDLIGKESFDVILSSSPYPTSHVIASHIKKCAGVFWLADFRDTWTQNPIYPFSKTRLFFEQRYEKSILKDVNAIITVSDESAQILDAIHDKDIAVIPNGYQGDLVSRVSLDKDFTITYTGVVYLSKQAPDKFFVALSNLLNKGEINKKDVRVDFYGRKENWLAVLIRKFDLEDIVVQHGLISREAARIRQEESQLLLFFNWEERLKKGPSSLKLYEYLRSGRPILATGGSNFTEDGRVLKEANAGVCTITIESIERELLKAYKEYKIAGRVSYNANLNIIRQHSYLERAKLFDKLMIEKIPFKY